MGLGVGIFLIAVGAILAFAVHATSGAVDIHTVGWILMGVGLASVLIARYTPRKRSDGSPTMNPIIAPMIQNAAFDGARIIAINGRRYSSDALRIAVMRAPCSEAVDSSRAR